MSSFRKVRDTLLLSHCDRIIDNTEFALLYDFNFSRNPDFPYWHYDLFDLDKQEDSESKAEFMFLKNDIYSMVELLHIPQEITSYNRAKVNQIEALAIFFVTICLPF